MKIAIDIGHNCPPDTGATGIQQEDKLTLEVSERVILNLKALGHEVVNCLPQRASSVVDSLRKRCVIANDANADIFISIHFNAFSGRAFGTEVFAVSNEGKAIAKPVLSEIVKLGFLSRGVKDGGQLYVIKNTDMPAILIECCFCDSRRDMALYNAELMAAAITRGLLNATSN